MAQYIDKDALVAEIERRLKKARDNANTAKSNNNHSVTCVWSGHEKECHELISFINTLEVKEVNSLTPEEIKKICTIYDNLKQERECATVLYNSNETFFNHVLMEYKSIAQKGE